MYGEFKTNWANFINAYIAEELITGSCQNNFKLVLQFYKEGEDGYFESKILLRNTIDKGDEEIIQAIRFYNEAYTAYAETKNELFCRCYYTDQLAL